MAYRRITPQICEIIRKQREEGKSIRSISQYLLISKSTLSRYIQRYRDNQNFHPRKLGRPHVTSDKTDRTIILAVKKSRFSPIKNLAKQFNLSETTIKRRCKLFELKIRITGEDVLTNRQKMARVDFCHAHLNCDFFQV